MKGALQRAGLLMIDDVLYIAFANIVPDPNDQHWSQEGFVQLSTRQRSERTVHRLPDDAASREAIWLLACLCARPAEDACPERQANNDWEPFHENRRCDDPRCSRDQPDRTVRDAARLMDEMNIGVLPVCDGRRLIGMVTDRDITVRSTAAGIAPDQQASARS